MQNEIVFIYNGDELLAALCNNNVYYYVKNAMGDVIALQDDAGNTLMEYRYNAWGDVTQKEISILQDDAYFCSHNPFTYRSYYYDSEGFGAYYLQSRYYEDSFCRFLNADIPDIALESKDEVNGQNLFAYCCNDPVNNVDPTGYEAITFGFGLSIAMLAVAFFVFVCCAAIVVSIPGQDIDLPSISFPSINTDSSIVINSLKVLLALLFAGEGTTTKPKTKTIYLEDTVARPRPKRDKEYRFCYVRGNSFEFVGGYKGIAEILTILGINRPITDLTKRYKLKIKSLQRIALKAKKGNP